VTAHLLLITLGPVQEFIAQARRTRDLWYGSHVLSELGRAAARALVNGGAELIFPALQLEDSELEPCLSPLRLTGKPPTNIPNKILARVPSGTDPAALAASVRDEVMGFWREDVAGAVKAKSVGLLASDIDDIWKEQIDTFVEFAASWAPLDDYVQARRQLEEAIGSRKYLRDFKAWVSQRGNAPKSSLDGARETVLLPAGKRDPAAVARYRIADREQLDAVGLVKRAGGEPGQFVPVVNVALASWLELAAREAPAELDAIKTACQAVGISPVMRPDLPCAQPFPFDASVMLPSRWKPVFEEQGLNEDAESWGRQHVLPILNKLSEPYPYVACLVADGDRMGRAIDHLDSDVAHRGFSAGLSEFATEARKVVEQEHRGALVYAGGDDVLAFLPLPEALACADALRLCFGKVVSMAASGLPSTELPTLSVGLGVGHVMEGMGDLLALGRRAEREAKRDRNALAVLVDKRSGGQRSWRSSWDSDPVARLMADSDILAERLSSRKVYEISRTLRRLPEPQSALEEGWARLLALEVRRSLTRVDDGGISPEDTGLLLDDKAGYVESYEQIRTWVDRLLIARTFAEAKPHRRDKVAAA